MTRLPAGPASLAARLTWGVLAGPALDDVDRARLALGLGGVVLFERNVESPEQLRELTRAIRAAAAGPVRISVDQEGGHVVRVGEPMTAFPGPMAIAATRSASLARAVARASGRELRSLGIDTVLAPVVDVATALGNPGLGARAFGDRPSAVARLAAAMVRGYLEGGVLPVPKHLPGHGRTAQDSHVSSATVSGPADDLARLDLPPLAAAVAAGAPMLMTGHVVHEALDRHVPASLSPATTRLARETLGFDGLLVTDALVMDAITTILPLEEAGAVAILAGMDVAMALEGQRRVLAGLEAAIAGGRIPDPRIADALAHADALDAAFAATPGLPLGAPLPAAAMEEHASIAAEVASRSITLVGDPRRLLPLDPDASLLVVDVASPGRSPIEGAGGRRTGAGQRLRDAFPRSLVTSVAADDQEGIDALVAGLEDVPADAVVILSRDAYGMPGSTLPVRLSRSRTTVIHVALRSPLDLAVAGEWTRIAAYADTTPTIDALAAALSGRSAFPGRLPVTLPASLENPMLPVSEPPPLPTPDASAVSA